MKKLWMIRAALLGAALFAILGIVGAVERGAALGLMWWTVPAVIVLWWSAKPFTYAEQNRN